MRGRAQLERLQALPDDDRNTDERGTRDFVNPVRSGGAEFEFRRAAEKDLLRAEYRLSAECFDNLAVEDASDLAGITDESGVCGYIFQKNAGLIVFAHFHRFRDLVLYRRRNCLAKEPSLL